MNKRPKSREETPKEGSDSARRYRTATICDRAAQSARVFDSFPVQNSHGCTAKRATRAGLISAIFQRLRHLTAAETATPRDSWPSPREFVIGAVIRKLTVSKADSKAEKSIGAGPPV
jgi:hypothetical protein